MLESIAPSSPDLTYYVKLFVGLFHDVILRLFYVHVLPSILVFRRC